MPPRAKRLSPRSKKREAELAERVIIRQRVLARDRHRCQLALAGAEHGYDVGECWGGLEAHHIVKASQLGPYSEENLVTLCSSMNYRLEAEPELAAFARSVGLVKLRGD